MKIVISFLFINLLIGFSSPIFAQIDELAFRITNYEIDWVNYDQIAINQDLVLSFYQCSNGNLCMSNFFRKSNTQSDGGIYGVKEKNYYETETQCAQDEFHFTWKYFNTYDSNRGEAAVTLNYIYEGSTVKMTS
jgi:hypothetical protein